MADRKITIQVSDSAIRFLGALGYDPMYGARPVKRVLQQHVENVLARGILKGEFGEEDAVIVDTELTSTADMSLPTQRLTFVRADGNNALLRSEPPLFLSSVG